MIYDDQEARVRRIVKVAFGCMAIAILIAIVSVATAHGQTIISPWPQECAPGASCYHAFAPVVWR